MKFLHLLFLLTICSLLQAQPCREVSAFYPSWKWYDRGRLVNPSTIDYSKYTIINYAFLEPETDGTISLFDPYADKTLLVGEISPSAPRAYKSSKKIFKDWHIEGTSLVENAHANGVKVIASIGGWTMSKHFSTIAESEQKRRTFAKSCAELVLLYDIDGVDIDWEYPGYRANGGQPQDKENFTLLLQEIRHAFNVMQLETGKRLFITADFGAGLSHMERIEWDKVVPLLDYINLMTYDFYGSTPSRTNHHSPLFAPKYGLDGFDIDSAVRYLTERFQVPASKINIGLAFFGRSLKTKGQADIHVATKRLTDSQTFAADKGAPAFYNILANVGKFNYHWDDHAEVPFLKGKKLQTFVTFEDERSIKRKAQYILENGLAGAIVWDITSDCVESKRHRGTIEKTPLADALKNGLCRNGDFALREKIDIEYLPANPFFVSKKIFAPRLIIEPDISKKEKRQKKRKEKKWQKRNKKKKGEVPNKYFDGGW